MLDNEINVNILRSSTRTLWGDDSDGGDIIYDMDNYEVASIVDEPDQPHINDITYDSGTMSDIDDYSATMSDNGVHSYHP